MRARQLTLLLVVVLAACNSLLGNIDHHLVDESGGADAGPALLDLLAGTHSSSRGAPKT